MRILMGAATAALLMAAPAAAQTGTPATAAPSATVQSACGAVAPPPTLLDGATATREQMTAANEAYTAWFTANRDALNCLRTEVEEAQARWQALRESYNAGADMLNTTNTAWQAEVEEFNGRDGQRSRSSRTLGRQ